MACIKKRRGKWVVDYRDTEGRRRWVTCDGNREEAEMVLSKIVGGGKRPVDRKATFKESAEQWLEREAKGRLKRSTYLEYKAALDNHLIPFFGGKRFCKVERQDVIAFIEKKKNEAMNKEGGLSRSTIKNLIAPLRSMYFDAAEESSSTYNPAVRLGKYLPAPDLTKAGVKPLNREEIQHLLATIKEKVPHWHSMVLCAARTGLRLGELVALRWEQVDFHGRFIVVNHNFSRGEFTTPKSGKSREVDMSRQTTENLKALLTSRKAEALKNGTGQISELVFLEPTGERVDWSRFTKRTFYRTLELAQLRRVKFHSLRHSYASMLIEQGEDLNYVKRQLGHHSITITVDTYGHVLKDDRTAVDGLDNPSGSKMVANGSKTLERGAGSGA